MYTAQEVIKDKFWIVYSNGSKIGTLRFCDESYEFFNQSTEEKQYFNSFNEMFKVSNTQQEFKDVDILNVGGFTTGCTEIFEAQEGDIPMFKKSAKAKTFYAAGHYVVKFDGMGWQWATTPKVDTLHKYSYRGPFLTEWEMQLELKKCRRGSVNAYPDSNHSDCSDTS